MFLYNNDLEIKPNQLILFLLIFLTAVRKKQLFDFHDPLKKNQP